MRTFVSILLFMSAVMLFGCTDPGPATMMIESVDDHTVEQPDPTTASTGMVLIRAGEFQMGSNAPEAFVDEQPVHPVYLNAFYMDRYEVTNAQYQQFVLKVRQWQKDRIAAKFHDGNYLKHWNGNNYLPGKGEHPVVYVSWYAAMAYAEWTGKHLPTEAEWEKAARGGLAGQKYPLGNSIDANGANYGRHIKDTVRVGQYPANGYGLYDMAGNVWEWCSGAYDNVKNSRVMRGGSWSVHALDVRVSFRGWDFPTFTSDDVGFRCVK